MLANGAALGNTPYWNGTTWIINNSNIFNNGAKVGIGTTTPSSKLHVIDTLSNFSGASIRVRTESISSQKDSIYRGIDSRISGTSGSISAFRGISHGFNSQENMGVIGFGFNAVINRGIAGVSNLSNTNASGFNYGVYGQASKSEYANIAIGGYATNGITTTGNNFGVVALSTSTTSGTNYGIYSEAKNGGINYAGFFNGDVTITGSLTNPSDIKLKSNIKQLNNVLPLIRQLNPVEYDYKKELSGKKLNLPENHQYGFIAQEIQTILPELVSNQKINLASRGSGENINENKINNNSISNETLEFIGVNYISVIPILVQGLKEQDSKINELESVIMELKKQIEELKN